jgi:uncharacterized membrane protein (DUF485 family)
MVDAPPAGAGDLIRRKARLYFSLFGVFFVFYVGTAILQTPECRSTASIDVMGTPLGLLLSLAIFPVSWIIIAIFFVKGK